LETFPSPGTYTATLTVMDQFGATNSTSTTFSVGSGAPAVMMPSVALQQDQQPQQRPTQPIGPP
jgi:PKD repeat protein